MLYCKTQALSNAIQNEWQIEKMLARLMGIHYPLQG